MSDRLDILVDHLLHASQGHGNDIAFLRGHHRRTIAEYVAEMKADTREDGIAAANVIVSLTKALHESVKLQSHYATLLNMYDGGHRRTFTAEEWTAKLRETGAI